MRLKSCHFLLQLSLCCKDIYLYGSTLNFSISLCGFADSRVSIPWPKSTISQQLNWQSNIELNQVQSKIQCSAKILALMVNGNKPLGLIHKNNIFLTIMTSSVPRGVLGGLNTPSFNILFLNFRISLIYTIFNY